MAAPPQEVHVPNNLIVVIIKEIIQRVIASFLHDTVEFVRVDLAISVTISLVNHVLRARAVGVASGQALGADI